MKYTSWDFEFCLKTQIYAAAAAAANEQVRPHCMYMRGDAVPCVARAPGSIEVHATCARNQRLDDRAISMKRCGCTAGRLHADRNVQDECLHTEGAERLYSL